MSDYHKWIEKETQSIRITGNSMTKLDIKFEVGQFPVVKADIILKPFLEGLTLEQLNDLKELCSARIKCLMK